MGLAVKKIAFDLLIIRSLKQYLAYTSLPRNVFEGQGYKCLLWTTTKDSTKWFTLTGIKQVLKVNSKAVSILYVGQKAPRVPQVNVSYYSCIYDIDSGKGK